ncbi:hypothetical protein HPO96_10115 [Kribbella sandramycini]|uniref:Uncharacterized protein n=1 Tax=Kribbella sandramycini TaxID=60450 RepID=A0A7Y4KXS5_9ACTN|nr:hypothetical protein [Kribbella sandramycini]MBB6569567.1 hypothetical protein [Kribbella sandramycini]NOL40599.1 hypothetical protein [Kribbella sandramycini]
MSGLHLFLEEAEPYVASLGKTGEDLTEEMRLLQAALQNSVHQIGTDLIGTAFGAGFGPASKTVGDVAGQVPTDFTNLFDGGVAALALYRLQAVNAVLALTRLIKD